MQTHETAQHVPANHYSWLILDVGMRRPNQPWLWPDWLLLPKTSLQRLTDLLRQNEQPVWHGNREIRQCFERIDEAVALGETVANRTRLKILINELLVLLAELLESRNPRLDETLAGSERTVLLFLENLHRRLDEPLDARLVGGSLRRHRIVATDPSGGGVNEPGVAGDEGMERRLTLPAQPVG